MIIKTMLHAKDVKTMLKYLQYFFGACISLGILGFLCYFLLVSGSSLSDFAQGVYAGISSGLLAAGAIGLIRLHQKKKNPEALRKMQIEQNDEREQLVRGKAFQYAGLTLFYLMIAAMLVVLPFSEAAFCALLLSMLVYCAAFFLSYLYLSKKL